MIKNKILLARADAKYKDILSRLGQLSKQQTEHFDTSTTSSTTRILNSIKTTLDPWKKTTSASTVLALNKLSETVGVLVSILDEINTEGTRILVQGVTDLETDIKNGDNIINNFYTTFFPEEFAARVTTATLLPDSAKVKVCKKKYFRDFSTYTNTLVAELENSFMTFYNGNKNLERVILKGLDNITDTAIAGINTINNCKKSNKIFSVHDLDVATTPAKEAFNDCLAWVRLAAGFRIYTF